VSPVESDRLYRLARVLAHANRVFEDRDESADWIQTPNAALEQLVRQHRNRLPPSFVCVEVEIPEGLAISEVRPEDRISPTRCQ